MLLRVSFDPALVLLSLGVALLAAYTAMGLLARMGDDPAVATGRTHVLLIGLSAGLGIWAMHFVGMLAFSVGIPVHYDLPLTALSLLLAVAACLGGAAIVRRWGAAAGVRRESAKPWAVLAGGATMGLAIPAMHYVGMAAMRMNASVSYDPVLVGVSVVIGLVAGVGGAWAAGASGDRGRLVGNGEGPRLAATLLFGGGIAGMHYTAIGATTFYSALNEEASPSGVVLGLGPEALGLGVGSAAILILVLTLFAERLRRRTAESAVKGHYYQMLNAAPDGMVVCNDRGEILFVNRAMEALTGYHHDDLLGREVEVLVPLAWRTGHRERRAGYAASPKVRPMGRGRDRVLRRKDGSEVPVDISLAPLETEERRLVIAGVRDASERRRAFQDLQRSEEKYRGIFNNAVHGIEQSTRDGRLLAVNPALVRMLGYDSVEEVLALDLARDVYESPDDRRRIWEELDRAGQVENVEVWWKTKDGGRVLVRIGAWLLKVADSGEDVKEAIVEDITEHRKLEGQLRQSQKMEAIGQLTSGMAHDFNNLLSIILANAQLASESVGTDSDLARESISEIASAAGRGADVVTRLLGFGRRAMIRQQRIDLSAVVREALETAKVGIPESIALKSSTEMRLPPVAGDPSAVEQILLNLVNNARDAMPRGGRLEVGVSAVHLDESFRERHPWVVPGEYVCLSVSDTGVGMTPEECAQVFEPFYTTKPRGMGTGLGLAMVYGLVKQLGGAVHVYSEPGMGTTVRVYFPVSKGGEAAAFPAPATAPPREGSETILLVEDEGPLLRVGRKILERYGYRVLTAADGMAALKLYEEHAREVALVVSDAVMPGMSGEELYEAVREQARRISVPAPPLILMSGYQEGGIPSVVSETSPAPFLQKPWTAEELARKVREVLDDA